MLSLTRWALQRARRGWAHQGKGRLGARESSCVRPASPSRPRLFSISIGGRVSKRPERQDGASGGGGVGRVGSSTSTRLTPLTGVLMTDAAGGLVVRRVRV